MSHREPELWAALESAHAVEDNEIQQAQLEDVVYALRRSVAHIAADWGQEQQYFRQWLAAGGPRSSRTTCGPRPIRSAAPWRRYPARHDQKEARIRIHPGAAGPQRRTAAPPRESA